MFKFATALVLALTLTACADDSSNELFEAQRQDPNSAVAEDLGFVEQAVVADEGAAPKCTCSSNSDCAAWAWCDTGMLAAGKCTSTDSTVTGRCKSQIFPW